MGYSIQRDGNDGIIPASDPKLNAVSDILLADPEPMPLASEN